MKYLIIVFISVSSCTGVKEWRAKRKIRKARELDPSLFMSDTLRVKDTIYLSSFIYDTLTQVISKDTVIVVDNSRVTLKYFHDSTTKEIWHEVECKGDTVYLDKEVIVEKVRDGPNIFGYDLKYSVIVVIIIALLYIIIRKPSD